MTKPTIPRGLQYRGKKLWRDLVEDNMPADKRELLVEICRTADRLEELDRAIRGEAISELFKLEFDDDELEAGIEVKVDALLMEARHQQNIFKQNLVALRQLSAGSTPQGRGARGSYNKGETKPAQTGPVGVVGGRSGRAGWRGA